MSCQDAYYYCMPIHTSHSCASSMLVLPPRASPPLRPCAHLVLCDHSCCYPADALLDAPPQVWLPQVVEAHAPVGTDQALTQGGGPEGQLGVLGGITVLKLLLDVLCREREMEREKNDQLCKQLYLEKSF